MGYSLAAGNAGAQSGHGLSRNDTPAAPGAWRAAAQVCTLGFGLEVQNAYLEGSSLKSVLRHGVGGSLGDPIGPPVVGGVGTVVAFIDPEGEPVVLNQASVGRFALSRGGKRYELKNHLGNVLSVVTDLKLGQGQLNVAPAVVDFYLPQVVEVSDYYPFGWQLPGRNWRSGARYRYAFQGQEGDDAWSGEEASVFFKYRVHDPRIGRFLSVDPLAAEYAGNSVYAFSENRVIDGVELEGLEYSQRYSHLEVNGKTAYKVFNRTYYGKENENTYTVRVNDKMGTKILNGEYVFSKNYGWIDANHAFKYDTDTKFGGLLQLAEQLQSESGESRYIDGKDAFKVTYQQSSMGLLYATKSYWVAKGLSNEEKLGVARGIVFDVSIQHEEQQSIGWYVGSHSSFEPSDIPSNLLGITFWMEVDIAELRQGGDESYKKLKSRFLQDAGAFSPKESFEVYRQYPGAFEENRFKNRSWQPIWFPTDQYSPDPPVVPGKYMKVGTWPQVGVNYGNW